MYCKINSNIQIQFCLRPWGGTSVLKELHYVRPPRVAFSVPLNICKGIYFMNAIGKRVFFNDQRCNSTFGLDFGFGTSGENNENVLVKIFEGLISWKKSVRVYFSYYSKDRDLESWPHTPSISNQVTPRVYVQLWLTSGFCVNNTESCVNKHKFTHKFHSFQEFSRDLMLPWDILNNEIMRRSNCSVKNVCDKKGRGTGKKSDKSVYIGRGKAKIKW